MIKYVFYIIFISLFFSCSEDKTDTVRKVHFAFGETKEKESFEFKFIPLETTDDCLIGQISDIKVIEDRIFVLDATKAQALFVFDLNGRIITEISASGNNTNYKIKPFNFDIDTDGRRIMIHDIYQKRLFYYDLDSYEYISKRKIPFSVNDFCFVSDNRYIWFSHAAFDELKLSDDWYVMVSDSLLKPVAMYYPAVFKTWSAPVSLSSHNIFKIENRVFVYHQLFPVVYEITDDAFTPAFELSFESLRFPTLEWLNDEINKDPYYKKLENADPIRSYGILASSHQMYIPVMRHNELFVATLNAKNLESELYKMQDFTKITDVGFPLNLAGVYGDYFIASVSMSWKGKVKVKNEELRTLMEKASEEDNPILVLFKYK